MANTSYLTPLGGYSDAGAQMLRKMSENATLLIDFLRFQGRVFKHPADSSGKAQVTVEMPADARRMALEVWGYTDASGKLDVNTVELVSVTAQAK